MATLIPTRAQRALIAVTAVIVFAIWRIGSDPLVEDRSELDPHSKDPRVLAQLAQEHRDIERITELALQTIKAASAPDGRYKRDAHPAPHGCVKAQFTVRKNLAENYRHGVLAEPGKTYDAWIRFSNGLFFDDRELDARGMAIKLMGVPGEKLFPSQRHLNTQDFVMINHHTFPIADVAEFVPFFEAQVEGDALGYFLGWNPAKWRLREMRIGWPMVFTQVASPLSTSYFSMLPYKLGEENNIKYSMKPCDPKVIGRCKDLELDMPEHRTAHYLRDALIEALEPAADGSVPSDAAARFVFRVQTQDPSKNMPIENASVEWNHLDAPYVAVADVRIPAQEFSTEAQNTFCENLSFSPWHALPAHEPIGGLNRARFVLYDEISKARHKHNGVVRHEPQGFCLRLDGKPCDTALVAEGGTP